MAPGERVGLALPRGADLVAGILAAFELGCAYVPLDPDYPPARLAYMLHDAGVGCVLTDARHAERLGGYRGRALDPSGAVLREPEPGAPTARDPRTGPDAAAYVIYTSGSTGDPKGVLGDARQRGRAAARRAAAVRLHGGRPLGAVPLGQLRLLGLGAVGRVRERGRAVVVPRGVAAAPGRSRRSWPPSG